MAERGPGRWGMKAALMSYRVEVGLPPLHPIPERGPGLSPEEREALQVNREWWEQWMRERGWR
jgi:hypothetical protein